MHQRRQGHEIKVEQEQPTLRRRKKRRMTRSVDVRQMLITASMVLVLLASMAYVVSSLYSLIAWMRQPQRVGGGHHHRKENADDEVDILPWNPIYRVPEAMETVGDRSDAYAQLRMEYDQLLPVNKERSMAYVKDQPQYLAYSMDVHNSDQVAYDIYNCPETPPAGYPFAWKITQILESWPADDTSSHSHIYQGLCVFDYETDYQKAVNYRNAELPFVVVNDPQVARAVERWNQPDYLSRMLGDALHRTEYSENNHFMYYTPQGGVRRRRHNSNVPENWKEPTEMMRMTYDDWLEHANITDDSQLGPDHPHWYFRLIGCGYMGADGSCDAGSSEYLFDELPFFQPKESLYIVDPDEQKGIHCRFGMKGVIAENHFDGSRNAIVVLGGSRRYILSHPDQCENLALFPKGHPSARHSSVEWSNPEDWENYPEFQNDAFGNEVVMQAGQVLYLPTNWFHFIVSLELNFQCNTRSGISEEYMAPIHDCGF